MARRSSTRTTTSIKWLLAGAVLAGLAACGGGSDVAQVTARQAATLSGEQEVPPTTTGALGIGSLAVQTPSGIVSGSISIDGMTATMAHVHEGGVGGNGPIVVGLVEVSPGVWAVPPNTILPQAQIDAFRAGNLYFNAHNAAFPNGEIRGQIGREVFTARLSPAQEVPPTPSAATGTGFVSLDPATWQISARIALTGMAATMAHIHTGAAGVNGGILVTLAESPPGSGIWVSPAGTTLTEAQVAMLRSGQLYFNAHSLAFQGGETRGQIGRHVAFATLDGAQEVSPTASLATGTGTLVVDPLTRGAIGHITLAGMTATQAHIHQGAPGTNGPIIVHLVNTAGNVWAVPSNTRFTVDQLKAFKEGNLYFNAHNATFPNGEIRGRIR